MADQEKGEEEEKEEDSWKSEGGGQVKISRTGMRTGEDQEMEDSCQSAGVGGGGGRVEIRRRRTGEDQQPQICIHCIF